MLAAVEHLYVVTHDEVGIATEQKLRSIHLRTARLDGHVETGRVVKPGSSPLVEAAFHTLAYPSSVGDSRERPCRKARSLWFGRSRLARPARTSWSGTSPCR